jgi:hypothetical protein
MREGRRLRLYLDVLQPEGVSGDTSSSTTVALVGDSNAAMWQPALAEIATQRHWRLETMAKAHCPLLDVTIVNRDFRRYYTECDQWRQQVVSRLQTLHPKLVVVSMRRFYGPEWGRHPFDAAWMDSITRLVRQLRDTGTQVLVLGPAPDLRSMAPICLSGHLNDPAACGPVTIGGGR